MIIYDDLMMVGQRLSSTIKDAIKVANDYNDQVKMNFNGITLVMTPGDSPSEIEEEWERQWDINHQKYCRSLKRKILERRCQKSKRIAAEEAKKGIYSFSIVDEDDWRKCVEANKESPEFARFMSRFAHHAEKLLRQGKSLTEENIKKLVHKTELEGLSGTGVTLSLGVLKKLWTHGSLLDAYLEKYCF